MKAIKSTAQITTGFEVHEYVRVGCGANLLNMSPPARAKLSLAQRLALFDPEKHGGEVMAYCDMSQSRSTAARVASGRPRRHG